MHELSIATNISEIVLDSIKDEVEGRVSAIRLRIGALTCVHADALRFSFELVAKETPLDGAKLEIFEVPVSIYCPACQTCVELDGIQRFRCPTCDTPSADIRAGRELEIESIEFSDDSSSEEK